MSDALGVLLNDLPVGTLVRDRHDACELRLLESYKRAYPRPVLGQIFLDDPDRVHRSRARVPPWFSNLLPEGPLRELIARQAGVPVSREFFLLRHLGEDLPGAVRIVSDPFAALESEESDELAREAHEPESEDNPESWHFSLAGVQLKFSAGRTDRGLTIPVGGRGGDWIVKLPDGRYPNVPQNEHATMRWAQASGIEIPEIELIPVSAIQGLPDSLGPIVEKHAFAVRRFDRTLSGGRIHMEDFAQILGLYPEEKYRRFNYETLASLIHALTGAAGLDAFVRRLVFVLACGNGDAHHKNWSLIYPDGVRAELSPAYDLVATIPYKPDDTLALNLAKSKRWDDASIESFRRMARKIGADESHVAERAAEAADAIHAAWDTHGGELGYDSDTRKALSAHMRRIPLLGGPPTRVRA